MPLPPLLSATLTALTLAMAALVVFALWCPEAAPPTRRRWGLVGLGIAVGYLSLSGVLAASGTLADVEARPPAAALMLLAFSASTVSLGVSRVGDRLLAWPLAWLVGAQAFRVLVEAWLAAAFDAGVVPAEVTYHGHNLDVATGLAAVGLGLWLWRGTPPRWVVVAWNGIGLALLAGVVATAALSAFGVVPTEPRVLLPVTFPGVWLPAWLVQLALLGHVLVFRALQRTRTFGDSPPPHLR